MTHFTYHSMFIRSSMIALAILIANATGPQAFAQTLAQTKAPRQASLLTISVSPGRAEIIPGHATTCTELDTATTTTPPTDDDGGGYLHLADRAPVMGALRFPNFTMNYTGQGKVRVSYASVKVLLPARDYYFTINDTELSNLLGLDRSNMTIDGPTHIASNDASDVRRQDPSPFAPCGLVINDIPITSPEAGFVAPVEIKFSIYPDAPVDGQYEYEVTTTAEAEFIP